MDTKKVRTEDRNGVKKVTRNGWAKELKEKHKEQIVALEKVITSRNADIKKLTREVRASSEGHLDVLKTLTAEQLEKVEGGKQEVLAIVEKYEAFRLELETLSRKYDAALSK